MFESIFSFICYCFFHQKQSDWLKNSRLYPPHYCLPPRIQKAIYASEPSATSFFNKHLFRELFRSQEICLFLLKNVTFAKVWIL